MTKRLFFKFVISVGIAAFFLWLTVSQMAGYTDSKLALYDGLGTLGGALPGAGPSVSFVTGSAASTLGGDFWASLWVAISSVPLTVFLLYVAIFLVVHISRIWRWYYLVAPLGERDAKKVFRIGTVGFSAIVILPLRLGELVRPYLLSKESRVGMSAALGTAVVERVIDGLLVTGLLFISLATYSGDNPTTFATVVGYFALAIFAGASFMLTLAATRHNWTIRLLEATVGRVSMKLSNTIIGLVDGFLDGVRVLRREHAFLKFLGMTAIYWSLNAFGIMVLAQGFGFDVSYWQAVTMMSILVIGIMIPGGPGFFGNFQLFLVQGLFLFFPHALVVSSGLAFALVLNCVQFAIIVGFGVPFFLASHVKVGNLVRTSTGMPQEASPT